MIEVEQKYHVENLNEFVSKLKQKSFTLIKNYPQIDTYFQHPSRDFSQTDEALRLRCEANQWLVSYKGPRQPGSCKQRFELELPLATVVDTESQWNQLLTLLGFVFVAKVLKTRQVWQAPQLPNLTVALDCLTSNGTESYYCEIEMLVEQGATDLATRTIETTAGSLELEHVVRSSYLELVLAGEA